MSLTIVEIDPAVYDAARQWFGLPDPGPGNVYLEDARSWAAHKHASADAGVQGTLYDIVIHDCFSGGGVPEHIYTTEFWSDLKSTIHPDGVLVVVSVTPQGSFIHFVESCVRILLGTSSPNPCE